MTIAGDSVERRSLQNWIEVQDWFFKLRFPYYQLLLGYVSWAAWHSIWAVLASVATSVAADFICLQWRRKVKAQLATVDVEQCAFELAYYVSGIQLIFLIPLGATLFSQGFNHPLLIQSMAATHLAMLTASPVPKLRYVLPPIAVSGLGFIFPYMLGNYSWTTADFIMSASIIAAVVSVAYVHIQADQRRFKAEIERDEAREQAEKERARAEEANRIKSAFFAMMSHEIRTPMNAVVGFSDVLSMTSPDEKAKEYGGYIHDASQSLLTLLNDILDFSKIEADKIELEDAPMVLPDFVRSMKFWQGKAMEKTIRFEITEQDLPVDAVSADEGRLRQILSNFLSNAMKFTPEGGRVDLNVSTVSTDEASYRVRFEVADTGIGFTDEVAAKLFQPFVQADGSIAKNFGGTGLGLAISAKLAGLMGGKIGASAKANEGACFWIEIPFHKAKAAKKSEMSRAA